MPMAEGRASLSGFRLEKSFRTRLYAFTFTVVATFLIFIFQLFNLQIVNGEENALKAEKFVRKSESTPAARGQIFDRNFTTPETSFPIVSNKPSLDVILNTALFKYSPAKSAAFIKLFSNILGIPLEYYANELREPGFSRRIKSKKRIILLESISREQHERISSFENLTRYVLFAPTPRRIYHMGAATSHIIGYVGKPTTRDLLDTDIKSYQLLGKNGLELQYDAELRGMDGFRIQKRNTGGDIEEERVVEHAVPGKNLILSIDRDVQLAAFKGLKGIRGTAIALRPATGEVIAMVSHPGYDPNILSGKNRSERNEHYRKVKKYGGLLNLATQSKFPPASTFKTLVALAALESEHKIDYDSSHEFSCNGRFIIKSSLRGHPDQEFRCWEPGGHGTNDLVHAIEKSCSVYFYNLGYELGSESILSYARLFGLDKKTGIDLPNEVEGFIPSNEWKKRTYGTKWYDGDTINLSIGQGFISTTPLEMALFYMGIINYGKIYQPYIVSEIRDPVKNTILLKNKPHVLRDIPLKRSTIDIIKIGLRRVVKFGTASGVMNQANLPAIAGKTGTAQTKRRGESSSNHAWFIGYAPYNAPPEEQLLIVVFVEYGAGGAAAAAPVARDMFKAALDHGLIKNIPIYNEDLTVKTESIK